MGEHLAAIDLKLSLYWILVFAISFFSRAFRSMSRTLRRSWPFTYNRSKATITIFVEWPFSSFTRTEKSETPLAAGTVISPSMISESALM
jgi:hypothetical protein